MRLVSYLIAYQQVYMFLCFRVSDEFEEEIPPEFEDLPYIDVELPSLSDSFDLELGSLELHNSSTPLSLSPNAKLKQL